MKELSLLFVLLLASTTSLYGASNDDCMEEFKHGGIQAYESCLALQEGEIDEEDDFDGFYKEYLAQPEPCAGLPEECEEKEEKGIPMFQCEEICRYALDIELCFEQLCPQFLY